MRIVFITTTLGLGGAERALRVLATEVAKSHDVLLIAFGELAEHGRGMRADGINVVALNVAKNSLLTAPGKMIRLVQLLRQFKPDVVQTWMYHADFFGGLIARLATRARVVWGIRHTNLERHLNKRRTLLIAKLCARLSRVIPDRIVTNSTAAIQTHKDYGYDSARITFIPNGIDTDLFTPNASDRQSIRNQLGLTDTHTLCAMVGRFDAQKGFDVLAAAMRPVFAKYPDVRCLLMGAYGITSENDKLMTLLDQQAPTRQFDLGGQTAESVGPYFLLGSRRDAPSIYSAVDILVSSSDGEGFPNVVAEAMAMKIPVVGTNVGETAQIVDQLGKIVPPRDPEALGNAIEQTVLLERVRRAELGNKARSRITTEYSIPGVASKYCAVYESVARH